MEVNQYDAVFMDCYMPAMDGFETTETLRRLQQKDNSRIPIIALTAGALKEDKEQCLQAGMDDYLCKPVKKEALAQKLSRWLKPSSNHIH